jgi:hypothetical protein
VPYLMQFERSGGNSRIPNKALPCHTPTKSKRHSCLLPSSERKAVILVQGFEEFPIGAFGTSYHPLHSLYVSHPI